MKLIMYTKPNCAQCFPIKSYLKAHKVPYEAIDITKDEKAHEYIQSKNYQSLPVLFLMDGDKTIADTFSKQAAIDVPNWYKEGKLNA